MTGAGYPRDKILGVVLAGGLARRMGGQNKALLKLRNGHLIDHVLARLASQCADILISSNDDAAVFGQFRRTVIPDAIQGHAGPIAGVYSAMEWAVTQAPLSEWILSAPVDCPFLPGDLAERLWNSATDSAKPVALAASAEHVHYVCGLWHVSLHETIRRLLETDEIRRAETIAEKCGYSSTSWHASAIDPFFNINTADDLALAEDIMRQHSGSG